MSQTIESLWPETLTSPDVFSPLVILREQAVALGTLTNNVLEGEVITVTDDELDATKVVVSAALLGLSGKERQVKQRQKDPIFYHSFYIKAPALGNYRYRLFYVQHKMVFYPVSIVSEILQDGIVHSGEFKCPDEDKFKDALRVIFASERAHDVISALLSQSTSYTNFPGASSTLVAPS